VYFNVLANGVPYLLGTERLKGSHSMSCYHSTELCYLAAVYTNLLITRQPMTFYFKPKPGGWKDNILPVDVANELIANGSTQPQRYEEVSILFTDFRGFTNAVASLPAKKVVEELNDIFQHFDDIIEGCGIEKIKTIGDSYMIAGGLPKPLADHAERCVDAALKMLGYLEERNAASALKWNMRAGIHSGAVIAGVVGKRKFTYDVWGDTVNIASRMESAGEPGRVNVSAYAYDLVKSRYKGEYRGKLDAKGKGEIDMYFIVA